MTPQDFAQKVKAKYPAYQGMDDVELTNKIIAKYPQYADSVSFDEPSFTEKTGGVLNTVFGGGKLGEAIGTQIAKLSPAGRELARQEAEGVAPQGTMEETFQSPTGKEIAGDVARTGALFTPVGRIANSVATAARSLGIGEKVARTLGSIVAGGSTGAAADIGASVAEGGDAELGLGTTLGVGIPAGSPILGAISRATTKGIGKIGSEIQGALTGTSAETVEQAFNAARTGGKDLEALTSALRGKTTPERLVNTVRQNVQTINSQRQQLFKNTLEELGDVTVKTTPAKTNFITKLNEAGIKIGENGLLDFSGSKLKLVPSAQTKLQTAWGEVSNLGDDITLSQIDTTRQALKALSLAGDDPSANLANKLIDDAVREVRTVGEQVDGYGQMLDNFGETSEFLDELQRGLSSGDKSTVDQAYRRMATALKTNNEQRMALIKELDDATDGAVLSTIAGQQLSETLPRGLFRQIAAGIAGTGIVTGGITPSLIPALVFASPRATGEFVRVLGLTAQKTDAIIDAISDARETLIKIGAISGAVKDSGDLEQ